MITEVSPNNIERGVPTLLWSVITLLSNLFASGLLHVVEGGGSNNPMDYQSAVERTRLQTDDSLATLRPL
jgi:hypothetical protein